MGSVQFDFDEFCTVSGFSGADTGEGAHDSVSGNQVSSCTLAGLHALDKIINQLFVAAVMTEFSGVDLIFFLTAVPV